MLEARFFNPSSPLGPAHLPQEPAAGRAGAAGPAEPDADFAPDPDNDNLVLAGDFNFAEADGHLAREASLLHKAGQPALGAVAPRDAQAVERLKASGEAVTDALKAGVDLARSTFLRKVVGAVASVIALGVMAAATVATGGAAAPALAAACLATLSYAGDAVCAWREWKNEQALQAGDKLPYSPLPCGASAVGNLAFAAVRGSCKDDESAKAVAHKVEVAFAVGLMAFSLATCAVPPELKLAEEAIKFASLGLKSMMYMQATLSSAFSDAPAAGSAQARGLEHAIDRLDQALGPDDAQRGDRVARLLADPSTGQETRDLMARILSPDGQYDAGRADALRESLEKARQGGSEESPALLLMATCVNLVSLALVERALVAPRAE